MTEFNSPVEPESEEEVFPVEPHFHPIHKITRKIYDFFASAKLAMFLLVVILACCLAGTTIFRDKKAWEVIFSTVWFNGLLVLLVVNVACCFFGRIWGRKVTLISLGMILFHLSFIVLFLGVVYNSFFYFRGTLRLTEGETVTNGDPQSYDVINRGRFFSFTRLKGETTLIKMHTSYKVDNKDKRAAYEVTIGDSRQKVADIIYPTKHVAFRGFKYFPDKEGYSALVILHDRLGRELYGAHLPLQSLRDKDNNFIYATGTKDGPVSLPFPQFPDKPEFNLNLSYKPDPKKERSGDVTFDIYAFKDAAEQHDQKRLYSVTAKVGSIEEVGAYRLSVKEIRYWTAMAVRYEPGQPIILTSMWIGLFGMALTTGARIFRKKTPSAKAS